VIPKLHRILTKTSLYRAGQGLNGIAVPDHLNSQQRTQQQILQSHGITPMHIKNVLQHVSGVRTMTSDASTEAYYSLDDGWLMSYLNPKYGYNPNRGNLVLQLVERRLLQLLDTSPSGRYSTSEVITLYATSFREQLLFKPLGYDNFKGLIQDIPSLSRVYDNETIGPNGNQWFIQRCAPALQK
jgi:OST-HTH/LOTUS domain